MSFNIKDIISKYEYNDEKAAYLALKTLRKVQKKVGFAARP